MMNKIEKPLLELERYICDEGFEVLVLSASFEERCKQIAFAVGVDQIKQLFVCITEDADEKAKAHGQEIEDRFRNKVKKVEISKARPIDTLDALLMALGKIDENKKILLDISCFTHESLLIIRKVIKHLLLDVTYAYCPAKSYNPKVSKQEEKWLSRGVGELRSVLGYSGSRDPLKDSHLIVMVGFEVERAMKLIDGYEPNYLSLGYAYDGTSEGAMARNKARFKDILERCQNFYGSDRVKEFRFSAKDIGTTKAAINKQIAAFDANPIVAPMNTKVSTLALALASEEDESIQICYASALVYNVDDYSKPDDKCYIYENL